MEAPWMEVYCNLGIMSILIEKDFLIFFIFVFNYTSDA